MGGQVSDVGCMITFSHHCGGQIKPSISWTFSIVDEVGRKCEAHFLPLTPPDNPPYEWQQRIDQKTFI